LKVLVLSFKEVEGFCFCFWRLKVFVLAFKKVEGFVFAFGG
jgi:hypothetical protein